MRVVITAALALCVAACTKGPAATQDTPGELTPVELPTEHPNINPLPDPEANGGHAGRAPRRLSVPQLKESILTTTGRQWSQIDNLAGSLGQADFAVTVSDATEANLVFAKFLEDGAREVCLATAKADLMLAKDKRVLWPELNDGVTDFTQVDDATIGKNLQTLSTRFWGSPFEADELAEWTVTFKKVAARAATVRKPEQAWGSICIAMMTDPRFITY
ncbi:MAG: hypothetical protein ACO1OB_08440 [Archangium sp.]